MSDLRGKAILYKDENYFVYYVCDKEGGKQVQLIGETYKEDKSNQITMQFKDSEYKKFLKEIIVYE